MTLAPTPSNLATDCGCIEQPSPARDGLEQALAQKLSRITVSHGFRALVLDRFPLAKDRDDYRALLMLLMFSADADKENGFTKICSSTLAAIQGESRAWASRHYVAKDFLEAFKRDMGLAGFIYSEYSSERCRVVIRTGLPADILEALSAERATRVRDLTRRVYFMTGRAFSKDTEREQRKTAQEAVISLIPQAKYEDSRIVLEYMNGVPVHRFNQMVKRHMVAAYAKVAEYEALWLEQANRHSDRSKRAKEIAKATRRVEILYTTLRAIEEQPQPFYVPSPNGRTCRVYGDGASLLTLFRPVREVLTQDWPEYDLSSSQLAINSVLWEAPRLTDWLRRGGKIWQSIAKHMGLPLTADLKQILKHLGVYPMSYGQKEATTKRELTIALKPYGVEKGGSLFFSHKVVSYLLAARNRKMEQVTRDGGGRTIYGDFISPLDEQGDLDLGSILSQQAQAVEMKLMMPLYNLLNKYKHTGDLWCLLHQHDGVSVGYRSEEQRRRYEPRIRTAVKAEADRLGIPTYLEVK